MNANQTAFPMRSMCRVLGVSPRGLDDWQGRTLSQRVPGAALLL